MRIFLMFMLIEILALGPLLTNTIIISCEKTHQAAVIDPSFEADEKVLAYLQKKKLKLQAILLTHSHWDHIAGAKNLKAKTKAPLYVHKKDQANLKQPGSDALPLLYAIEGTEPDHLVKDKDKIQIGTIELEVIHTPGHSPGSVCYYSSKDKVLFSGDTLFAGTMGAVHLPTSSAEDMWPSLKKLSTLPPETVVIPGHGKKTTIGKEAWLKQPKERFF